MGYTIESCLFFYTKIISKIIIKVNPNKINITIRLLLFSWHSGISSIDVTYTIAPAAIDKIIGKRDLILITIKAPIKAAIGSTNALKQDSKNDFDVDRPVFLKNKLIAEPSRKFCSAIPKIKKIAAMKQVIVLS